MGLFFIVFTQLDEDKKDSHLIGIRCNTLR